MPQQRTIALSTLARIIDNFKKGRFDNCFGPETNLLNQLIQADLVTLLRTGKNLYIPKRKHTSRMKKR
jgi:hypothetical protein